MSAPPRAKSPFKKRLAPRRDLVGVDVEPLTYGGQRLLAIDRRQRDLRLENRAVVPANASRQIRFCSRQACRAQVENAPALAVKISRANSHHGALVGAAVDVPPNLEPTPSYWRQIRTILSRRKDLLHERGMDVTHEAVRPSEYAVYNSQMLNIR